MKKPLCFAFAIGLTGCVPDEVVEDVETYVTPGHEFIVDAGFGAESATLTLNDTEFDMEETSRDVFSVHADVDADASGSIEIIYNGDGATAYCAVGYITGGDGEPHRYVVDRLECSEQ